MKGFWNCVLLADMVDMDYMFTDTSGPPWMETAFLIMVGLMVLFAVVAVFFIHHWKKKEERDEHPGKEKESDV